MQGSDGNLFDPYEDVDTDMTGPYYGDPSPWEIGPEDWNDMPLGEWGVFYGELSEQVDNPNNAERAPIKVTLPRVKFEPPGG